MGDVSNWLAGVLMTVRRSLVRLPSVGAWLEIGCRNLCFSNARLLSLSLSQVYTFGQWRYPRSALPARICLFAKRGINESPLRVTIRVSQRHRSYDVFQKLSCCGYFQAFTRRVQGSSNILYRHPGFGGQYLRSIYRMALFSEAFDACNRPSSMPIAIAPRRLTGLCLASQRG